MNSEIENIIAGSGQKVQWIEHFVQYKNFSEINRRMLVTLVDTITVHEGARLDILFRYNYDYERVVSFALAVNEMHKVPSAEALCHTERGVA